MTATDVRPAVWPRVAVGWANARYWNLAVIVASSFTVGVLGWRHRALSDDGLIFLRTVRQILAGNGPVVNTGERTEANTSTLWQWILVAAGWITPADLGFTAVIAGLLLTTAGVAVAMDAARRLHGGSETKFLLPAGVLVLFAVPPFWDYATTGLDSGLGTFWLAGSWWLLVRAATAHIQDAGRNHLFLGSSVWIGLGPLVRPDMAIASVVFFAALTVAVRGGWQRFAVRGLAAVGLPVCYEIFRAGYYGLLVPLPAVAKDAGESEPDRGWRYVRDFLDPYVLYVPVLVTVCLLVLFVVRWSAGERAQVWGRLAVLLAPPVTALLMAAYVVWVGGDYMHARMLLPPMFLALMPLLVLPLELRTTAAVAVLAIWAGAVAGPWNPGAYREPSGDTTILIRTTDIYVTGDQNPDHVSDWTENFRGLPETVRKALAGSEPALVFFDMDQQKSYTMPLAPELAKDFHVSVQGGFLGVTGAIVPLDERIVERWGLANTVAAHLERTPGWRDLWPGHRKDIGYTWMIAMDALPGAALPPLPYPELNQDAIAAARRALTCGDLKELLDSTRESLTFSRFWDNLTGAFDRTSLVIPLDPYEAERKFCDNR